MAGKEVPLPSSTHLRTNTSATMCSARQMLTASRKLEEARCPDCIFVSSFDQPCQVPSYWLYVFIRDLDDPSALASMPLEIGGSFTESTVNADDASRLTRPYCSCNGVPTRTRPSTGHRLHRTQYNVLALETTFIKLHSCYGTYHLHLLFAVPQSPVELGASCEREGESKQTTIRNARPGCTGCQSHG